MENACGDDNMTTQVQLVPVRLSRCGSCKHFIQRTCRKNDPYRNLTRWFNMISHVNATYTPVKNDRLNPRLLPVQKEKA